LIFKIRIPCIIVGEIVDQKEFKNPSGKFVKNKKGNLIRGFDYGVR